MILVLGYLLKIYEQNLLKKSDLLNLRVVQLLFLYWRTQANRYFPIGLFTQEQNLMLYQLHRIVKVLNWQRNPDSSHFDCHVWVFYIKCNRIHTYHKVLILSSQSADYFPKTLGDHEDILFRLDVLWCGLGVILESVDNGSHCGGPETLEMALWPFPD